MINSTNIFKSIFIAIIVISILFSFNYYLDSSAYIDDMAYVMAIGVDSGKTAKYKISLQLSIIESSATDASIKPSDSSNGGGSSSGSESSSSANYNIYSSETDSIDSAINITNAYINKNINLSHCKVLVVSENIARNGIQDIINSVNNKVEVRPDCNIIIAKTLDNEFEDEKTPEISDLLEKYYDVTSNIENSHGYSEAVKLNDFYLNMNDSFTEPYSTLGIISNTSLNANKSDSSTISNLDTQSRSLTTIPNETAVESIGLAVFKKDKLVGTLTANQTLAHQLLKNEYYYTTLNIPSPFNNKETLDLYISSLKDPKIRVNIKNGSPFVEIDLHLTARILSFNSDTISNITEDNINIVKDYSSKYITDMFYDYFNFTAKRLNSDISGIGRYAAKNFSTMQDWEAYNWLENYKNATFKINVSLLVKSGHLLNND